MKTIEQVLAYKPTCIDGRDMLRLFDFFTQDQLHDFGTARGPGHEEPVPFTRENILKRLEKDVAFGFDKALNRRGISSGLMYEVVQMWNWILEEGLEDFDEYAQYGLPLFKATAVKYGFANPIGDDDGAEEKYSCDWEQEYDET